MVGLEGGQHVLRIVLEAPGTYAEDFEIEYEEFKKQQEPEKTLDDIIVKKN